MSKPKKMQIARYPYSEVVSLVKNFANDKKNVLEVGCGTGNNLVFFAENGHMATGIDLDINALAYAKKFLKEKKLKAKLLKADAKKLPFRNASFDLVLDRACLQHNKIVDVKKIIKEIYRVLSPGGIFIMIHFRSKKDYSAKHFKLDKTFAFYKDVTFIDSKELKRLLSQFEILYLEHLKNEILIPKKINRCHYILVARKK